METARTFHSTPETSEERRDFYARLLKKNTAPLWEVLAKLFPLEPRPACVPALWNYTDDIRPLLVEAGDLITAKEAMAVSCHNCLPPPNPTRRSLLHNPR